MTREDVFERLTVLFREFFDDDMIVLRDDTTAEDIKGWDSFEHINLMLTVEREFGIQIPMKVVTSMKNVGEMADIILEMKK